MSVKEDIFSSTGKFDSSYAGQLGTYVVAVNHQMKTEADNPTLGLLICKDMDKVEVSVVRRRDVDHQNRSMSVILRDLGISGGYGMSVKGEL